MLIKLYIILVIKKLLVFKVVFIINTNFKLAFN